MSNLPANDTKHPPVLRIKVCGMTDPAQVEGLEQLGVAFSGFIFYPKSPRYVLRHMTTQQIKNTRNINKVGVFVNASTEDVLHMVDECRLHMVQLHGDETPKFCEKIADYISVVKVFRIGDGDNISWKIREYMDVCDMFMFDTAGAGFGGTGKKFDWNMLKEITVGKPYFLSGGIELNDASSIKQFAIQPAGKALFAIDINSRFETSPGVKDLGMVNSFIKSLNA